MNGHVPNAISRSRISSHIMAYFVFTGLLLLSVTPVLLKGLFMLSAWFFFFISKPWVGGWDHGAGNERLSVAFGLPCTLSDWIRIVHLFDKAAAILYTQGCAFSRIWMVMIRVFPHGSECAFHGNSRKCVFLSLRVLCVLLPWHKVFGGMLSAQIWKVPFGFSRTRSKSAQPRKWRRKEAKFNSMLYRAAQSEQRVFLLHFPCSRNKLG